MRSRIALLFVFLSASTFALPHIAHAMIPFFGPIIPADDQTCALGWAAVIPVINNIIQFLITLAIVGVAPIMIAFAGFLYVINPINPSEKERAKSILTSTVIGIVVAMSGWLIVDLIMSVLYDKNAVGKGWYELVTSGSGSPCIPLAGSLSPAPPQGVGGGGQVGVVTGNLVTITAFTCKNASSCQVPASVNAQLDQMARNLQSAGKNPADYQITETGVNTTVNHASGSNNLDLSCHGSCSPDQVKAAIAAWPGSVKYETNIQSDYDAMIAAGISSANILGPAWFTGTFSNGVCSTGPGHCITAPHMSLNQ